MIESIMIRKIKGIIYIVFLMGLMLLMKARVSGNVSSGDLLDKPFCFKICHSSVDSSGYMEDLYSSDIKIDLYQIGDIQYISGEDSYELCNIEENKYEEVSKLNHVRIKDMNYTGSAWKDLSQDAIRKVMEKEVSPPVKTVNLGAEIRDIKPGLYLMLVRSGKSDNTESYIKISSEGKILTFVQTEKYEYTFEPNLIVIPLWSLQSELQDSTKERDYIITESFKYGESPEVYEIYIKTSRVYKEKIIDEIVNESSDGYNESFDNNKYSNESSDSDNSQKSAETNESYRSYRTDDSYKSGSSSNSIVKTGDDHNILLYCILALIFGFGSIIILVFSIYYKKRR